MLTQSQYDEAYFNNGRPGVGYTRYGRFYRTKGANSLGELYLDRAKQALDTYNLGPNTKVLEIGCGYGLMVESLNDLGVPAEGIDWSAYCHTQKPQGITLHNADATNDLRSLFSRNEFDVVFSLDFLQCISDGDMPNFVSDVNWICKFQQFHAVTLLRSDQQFELYGGEATFTKRGNTHLTSSYNMKSNLSDWAAFSWDKGTIIEEFGNQDNSITTS